MEKITSLALRLQEPLFVYHDAVMSAWVKKTDRAAREILTLIAVPVLYPITLALYVVGKTIIFLSSSFSSKITAPQVRGREIKEKVDNLEKEALPGWQELAIKTIRQARYASTHNELARLRSAEILTSDRESKISNSLSCAGSGYNSEAKMLYAQAFEIKRVYQKTHHVFLHAQAVPWMIYSCLLKEFLRKFQPETDLHSFKFLRIPQDRNQAGLFASFWNTLFGKAQHHSVQTYLWWKWKINDDDAKTREELLSADAYFYNYTAFESSLYFLVTNSNIVIKPHAIANLSKQVISHFCPSLGAHALDNLGKQVQNIAKLALGVAVGNLFTICIPKEESHNIQYRAHPYGPPCKCHDHEKADKILDDLQHEKYHAGTKCSDWKFPVPQFRIYTPLLTPEKGIKIQLLSPVAKEVRTEMKSKLRAIAEEVFALNSHAA